MFRDRCVGFQKVTTHDKRTQVKSWLGDWYPAEVEGCDCKSIADIGKGKQTYVKIGAFTFEAVKFALLDYAQPRRQHSPKQENSNVKSIAFEGDKLDGQVINFSPELNTFIGIRGSGKSTILEAIRYALDIPFGKNAADPNTKRAPSRMPWEAAGKSRSLPLTVTVRNMKCGALWASNPTYTSAANCNPALTSARPSCTSLYTSVKRTYRILGRVLKTIWSRSSWETSLLTSVRPLPSSVKPSLN